MFFSAAVTCLTALLVEFEPIAQSLSMGSSGEVSKFIGVALATRFTADKVILIRRRISFGLLLMLVWRGSNAGHNPCGDRSNGRDYTEPDYKSELNYFH